MPHRQRPVIFVTVGFGPGGNAHSAICGGFNAIGIKFSNSPMAIELRAVSYSPSTTFAFNDLDEEVDTDSDSSPGGISDRSDSMCR